MPLIDPTEGRYGSVSKLMYESSNYLTPQIINDGKIVPFWGKPPMFFWLSALSMKCFGVNEFSARLPSMLSAILLVLLIYWIIARYKDKETGLIAAIITFVAGGLFFTAQLVLLDMLLTLFTASSFLFYYAFLMENNNKMRKIFSICVFFMLALGFLTKGPVALVMFGLPVLFWTLFNKKWATLKDHAWWLGSILFLIITLPWFLLAERATPGFLKYFFVNENFLRFITHNYGDKYGSGHRFPYGTAIGFLLLTTLPWTLFIIFFLFNAFKKAKEPFLTFLFNKKRIKQLFKFAADKNEKFNYFLLGFVMITIFWCCARQLLIEYLIPAVPAFCIYIAILLQKYKFSSKKIITFASIILFFYFTAIIILSQTLGYSRSTKHLIQTVKNLPNSNKLKILFVRSTPKSAYFYGGKTIYLHTKESVNKSIKRGLSKDNVIFIIKKHYIKRISEDLKKSLKIIKKSNRWFILKKI
jgi:4-amino-4-deoxy-L-arabinose transferase-like glycosyltransferase